MEINSFKTDKHLSKGKNKGEKKKKKLVNLHFHPSSKKGPLSRTKGWHSVVCIGKKNVLDQNHLL